MNIKENEYIDKYTKIFKFVFFITFVINILLYASKKETILQRADYKILVQESEGSSNYVDYSSSDFPKNGYVLSSYECENGGVVTQNQTKALTFTGNADSCTLKFDINSSSDVDTLQLLQSLNPNIQVNSGTPNFSQIATTDEGLYSTQDDYGTSYYWRGAATTNYIQFGKNANNEDLYWRIVRINGDGSLRLFYLGNNINDNDYISYGPFNNSANHDNAIVGYMYGAVDSSTYEATHSNNNSSSAKNVLENWYINNFQGTTFETYISDTEFCYDRSIIDPNTGDGTGKNVTYYGSCTRNTTNKSPSLKCAQKNDRFTVSDTNVGNGDLSKPIGLITLDEIVMAGGTDEENEDYYLNANNQYWTGTPCHHDGTYAYVAFVYQEGDYHSYLVGYNKDIIPVINISQEAVVSLTGTGTSADPFVVH